jgi:hypothetical protein
MFGRGKDKSVSVEIDPEVYALDQAANRLRALEAEIVGCFEEWHKAQQVNGEKNLLVEFSMSKWLGSAWSAWLHDRSNAPTGVMDKP